jgi:hypothetical protein
MTDPDGGAGPGLAAVVHARGTQVLSTAMLVIGVALIAQLSVLSVVLGALFCAAGAGRLYVGGVRLRGRRRPDAGGRD